MFGWFRKKRAVPKALSPESLWTVTLDDDIIRVTDRTGAIATLAGSELRRVVVETNDSGPWGIDVWWLLFGPGDALSCAVPGGATGEAALLDHVMTLPGCRTAEIGKAMACTDNALFLIWERPD